MDKSDSTNLNWEDYCPFCIHYDSSVGVCSEIHENVRNYSKRFAKKCNSKYFEKDENIRISSEGDDTNGDHSFQSGRTVTITPQEDYYSVKFPDKCVLCGQKKENFLNLKLKEKNNMWSKKKNTELNISNEGEKLINEIKIPYCSEHYSDSKLFSNIFTYVSYGIPTLILLYALINRGVSYVFHDIFNIIYWVVILSLSALIAEFVTKLVLMPFFKSIRKMPLTKRFIAGSFGGGILGLKVNLFDDELNFRFSNKIMANEFAELNK